MSGRLAKWRERCERGGRMTCWRASSNPPSTYIRHGCGFLGMPGNMRDPRRMASRQGPSQYMMHIRFEYRRSLHACTTESSSTNNKNRIQSCHGCKFCVGPRGRGDSLRPHQRGDNKEGAGSGSRSEELVGLLFAPAHFTRTLDEWGKP